MRVDFVDGAPLLGGFGHRHAAGDSQAVRVVSDGGEAIAAVQARVGNLANRRSAVAPFRMHLQIAGVVFERGARKRRISQNATDCGAAQKVPPKLTASFYISPSIAAFDRA